MTRRRLFNAVVLAGLIATGVALAQSGPGSKATGEAPMGGMMSGGMGTAHAGHAHGMHGMMGGGMGMTGMMGGGGMMGCPMMLGDVDVKVEKRDNGVALTLTSKDPATARRLQKRAEIMRLMHELDTEERESGGN